MSSGSREPLQARSAFNFADQLPSSSLAFGGGSSSRSAFNAVEESPLVSTGDAFFQQKDARPSYRENFDKENCQPRTSCGSVFNMLNSAKSPPRKDSPKKHVRFDPASVASVGGSLGSSNYNTSGGGAAAPSRTALGGAAPPRSAEFRARLNSTLPAIASGASGAGGYDDGRAASSSSAAVPAANHFTSAIPAAGNRFGVRRNILSSTDNNDEALSVAASSRVRTSSSPPGAAALSARSHSRFESLGLPASRRNSFSLRDNGSSARSPAQVGSRPPSPLLSGSLGGNAVGSRPASPLITGVVTSRPASPLITGIIGGSRPVSPVPSSVTSTTVAGRPASPGKNASAVARAMAYVNKLQAERAASAPRVRGSPSRTNTLTSLRSNTLDSHRSPIHQPSLPSGSASRDPFPPPAASSRISRVASLYRGSPTTTSVTPNYTSGGATRPSRSLNHPFPERPPATSNSDSLRSSNPLDQSRESTSQSHISRLSHISFSSSHRDSLPSAASASSASLFRTGSDRMENSK